MFLLPIAVTAVSKPTWFFEVFLPLLPLGFVLLALTPWSATYIDERVSFSFLFRLGGWKGIYIYVDR